jgi:hypothetical protein
MHQIRVAPLNPDMNAMTYQQTALPHLLAPKVTEIHLNMQNSAPSRHLLKYQNEGSQATFAKGSSMNPMQPPHIAISPVPSQSANQYPVGSHLAPRDSNTDTNKHPMIQVRKVPELLKPF